MAQDPRAGSEFFAGPLGIGKGMFEEARSEFQKYSDLSPGSLPSSTLGYCFGRLGSARRHFGFWKS